MPETLTIHLTCPVLAVRVTDALDGSTPVREASQGAARQDSESASQAQQIRAARQLESRPQELAQLCALVGTVTDKLSRLHEETVANHGSDIARLAVEIARKILAQRVADGDYDVQTIIEEALKRSPTHQNIVVRVNPLDLPPCQKLQQNDPEGPFAALEFVADRSIARADCLVETPKGIVKSFVEQHLERIGEALVRVE